VEAQLWRKRLMPRVEPRLIQEALDLTEHGGLKTLIPSDGNYPASLHDLGDGAPYVLWVKGEESLLAMPESDRFTITGARAATSDGDQGANESSADRASDGKVIVAGGAYGTRLQRPQELVGRHRSPPWGLRRARRWGPDLEPPLARLVQ